MSFLLLGKAVQQSNRPAPVNQPRIAPPWDKSVPPDAIVYTTPPSEWNPPKNADGTPKFDRKFWRGDAWGITLPVAPPYVPGANTTPPEMIMTYFTPFYKQFGMTWIDQFITAHCQRSYSHYHLDRFQWDQAGFSNDDINDLVKYIISYGNYVSYWATGSPDGAARDNPDAFENLVQPSLDKFISSQKTVDNLIVIAGEELNNGMSPENIDILVDKICKVCNPLGIPVLTHYTSNVPCWPANGVPFAQWWADHEGKLDGICWQSDPTNTAGVMGAHFWDTRKYLTDNQIAVAFELRANEQLYGRCTELQAKLTSLELNFCPIEVGSNKLGVAGGGNGISYAGGTPV